MEGTREHQGKPRFDLIPSDALEEVAKVLEYGCNKYAERNWEKGMPWNWTFAATMRHLWRWWRGEDIDPESKLHHLAHAACDCLMLLAYVLRPGMGQYDNRERLGSRDPRVLNGGGK